LKQSLPGSLPLLPKPAKFARAAIVKPRLLALIESTNHAARLDGDPLGLVHRYLDPLDREVAGLLSAAVAYGKVDLFKPRLTKLLESLGAAPGKLARDSSYDELLSRSSGFHYRMTGPEEIAALLAGAGKLIREHGSMGQFFARSYREAGEPGIRAALGKLVDALTASDVGPASRRLKHLLPHPDRGSACKRLNLFLRWMIRGPDGVDLGVWEGVPPAALVIPLDTHVHRISGLVGLTRRTDLSWKTAEEITSRLRALDPDDPVRFDFSLSHLGISGSCPSRKDASKCEGCPLQPICKHWA
jgi:uncharacterized protein (TIGR02757 family)